MHTDSHHQHLYFQKTSSQNKTCLYTCFRKQTSHSIPLVRTKVNVRFIVWNQKSVHERSIKITSASFLSRDSSHFFIMAFNLQCYMLFKLWCYIFTELPSLTVFIFQLIVVLSLCCYFQNSLSLRQKSIFAITDKQNIFLYLQQSKFCYLICIFI